VDFESGVGFFVEEVGLEVFVEDLLEEGLYMFKVKGEKKRVYNFLN